MSLDILPISAKVKLASHLFMPRVKKKLSVLSVLFSVEFLSLGFFTNGMLSWSTPYVTPLLKATSHNHATAVKLDSPAKPDDSFVLASDGEQMPRSRVFFLAKETATPSLRSFVVVPLFFRIILAPKVSRYISKSVLNI